MSNLTPSNNQWLQNPHQGDDINLKELFMAVWGGRWMICVFTLLGAVGSLGYALSLPNMYASSALLAPAERSGSGLNGLMNQYGGLASLAGVSLAGSEDGYRADLAMEILKSRMFIAGFTERHDILPSLLAVKTWDETSGKLVFDPDVYNVDSKTWKRASDSLRSSKPSPQEAHKAFLSHLGLLEDKKTGYITLSIEHQSPIVAAQWVEWLVADINAAVKEQDVTEAKRSIQYLKQQVASTSLADLQAVFFDLIQSQTETIMLAEVRPEYVFKTIDPPVVAEDKSNPNRTLIIGFGTFFGGIFGLVMVLVRHLVRAEFAKQD